MHSKGVPVARIVPVGNSAEDGKTGNGPALIEALRKARAESGLTPEDAELWLRDLHAARAALIPARDRWGS